MMFVAGAFGTWLIERLADAARSRSATWLLGSEQQRALRAAGQTAIARTAAELRPDGSDDQVKRLAAILDQVFKIPVSAAPLKENITLLQELQAATTAQLAVLGDPTITGTEQSSVQALNREAEQLRDLSVEQITRTLVRNVLQEVLQQGTGGGALAPLANQLNFDLTHLQGRHTADMLSRIVDE